MKKVFLCIFLWLVLFNNCNAMDFDKLELIPVSESGNVSSDIFNYSDIRYEIVNDSYYVTFSSIMNKGSEKVPVSINLLLFDSNQENIGFLAYCSEYDYDSDYSSVKLGSNGSTPFSIKVLGKYFIEGKGPSDVSYISVLDDNSYCQVGDNEKYASLKIEDIKKGLTSSDFNGKAAYYKFEDYFRHNFLSIFLQYILIIGAIYVGDSLILGFLSKKMYGDFDINAFVPVVRNYLKLKLAFNEVVAAIGMFLFYFTFAIGFFTNEIGPWVLVSLLFLVATIRVILKLFFVKSKSNQELNNIIDNNINNNATSNIVDTDDSNEIESVKEEDLNSNDNSQMNTNNSINNDQESDLSKFFK